MHNEELEPLDECLEQVIVDIASRKFVLIGTKGARKEIDCDMEQFMSVLNTIRELTPIEQVTYV